MNAFYQLMLLAETSAPAENSSSGGSGAGSAEKLTEALKGMVRSPVFYIVIGAIVLLIVAFYLYRRIVKPQANTATVVIKGGKIYKIVKENDNKHFMTPFVERNGGTISLNEQEFTTDKLFINNGPDALYKINYTLKYKVTDVEGFYKYSSNIQNLITSKLNDDLREFADAGNALVLVKDYRSNAEQILALINKAIEGYSVQATAFKINLIEPLGKR